MSTSQWDNPDGVTPWRTPGPKPVGELFVEPSPDPSIADALALSAVPVAVHLYPAPANQPVPYLVVQPLDATASTPARRVRVAVVTADNPAGEAEVLPWDEYNYEVRRGLGRAVRRLSDRLK
jgi:hypothetical protein